MHKNYSKLFLLVPMLALLIMNHSMSHAQEDEDGLQEQVNAEVVVATTEEEYEEEDEVATVEEVVVTANRRQEMLQDVPLSIAAFTESFFEDTGLTDFKSLEGYAASLRITGGADSRRTGIRIRGIGTNGFNAGIDPSVGVFIDGIYQGRAGMSLGDFLDIERVEVLRGPQGSLYGKNTAAGAISVISKQPSYELEGKIEAVVANFNGREVRGMLNVPFEGEGGASAVRMAGYVVKRDGFDDNVTTGKEINTADKWGVKARTYIDLEAFRLGAITISLDTSKDKGECCAPDMISRKGPNTLGEDGLSLESLLLEPVNGPSSGAKPLKKDLVLPKDDPFDRKLAVSEDFKNDVNVDGVAVEWSIDTDNDFIYTWLNAHRHYDMQSKVDGDFTAFDGVVSLVDVNLDQVSSEFRIAAPEGETIDYQVGLYYYHSVMRTIDTMVMKPELLARLRGGALVNDTDFNPTGGPVTNVGNNLHKTTTYAMFGQATWNITDEFNATLGARFTKEKKERTGSQLTSPDYLPPDPDDPKLGRFSFEIAPVAGYPIYIEDGENNFTKNNFSPTLSLRYHPRHKLMYYTSVSRGFKSGGFNALRTESDANTQFDEEISTSYEIGWKGTWLEGGLQWNGTFFYVDYNDFQAQLWDGSQMQVRNAGRMESTGLELELTFVPSMDMMMGGSMGYNYTQYKEFDEGECQAVRAREWIDEALPGACSIDLEGQTIDNAPELTLSSYIHYSRTFTRFDHLFWFARLEEMYTSSFFHAQDLDRNMKNESTLVFNMRAGIGNLDETWELGLWVRNLTDEGTLVAAVDVPVLSGYIGWTSPPRTFGLTTKYNF